MPLPEPGAPGALFAQRALLFDVARRSIRHGLETGAELPIDVEPYPPALRAWRATFVTLHVAGALRGCTGTLEATAPLVADVAHNAWRSAFRDPRFAPFDASELTGLSVSVSVLSPLEPLRVASEAALLAALRPGLDGLVLREGSASATFLPAVWKSLPTPREFVAELKRKAGLPSAHWSDSLRFERYRVEELSE